VAVRQHEAHECGLACFAMVAAFHGHRLALDECRRLTPSAGGASFRTLVDLASRFGFEARGVEAAGAALAGVRLPAILHWNDDHFVVLEDLRSGDALIHDPNHGSLTISLDQLHARHTGFCLELTPPHGEVHVASPRRRNFDYLWGHLRKSRASLLSALVLTLALQAGALLTPYFAQVAIDRALPREDGALLNAVAVAFIGFGVLNTVVTLARLRVIRAVGAGLSASMGSDVGHRLLHLPLNWFRTRETGAILSKTQLVLPIKHALAEDLPAAFVNTILALLTGIAMLVYAPVIAVAGFAAAVAYGVIKAVFLPRQKAALSQMIDAIGKEQAFLMNTVRCMRSFRLACRESERHDLWNERFGDFVGADRRYRSINDAQTALQGGVVMIASAVVLWLGVAAVMRGAFTTGMLFAFMSYMTQFTVASFGFLDKYTHFIELDSYLDGLSDIVDTPPDAIFARPGTLPVEPIRRIELRGIRFGYGSDGPDILKDVNLTIRSGECVAIKGPSGGGKSTLAQILLGLVKPCGGSVIVNGRPLDEYGVRSYYDQVSAALQDEDLLSATVVDNISMFDRDVDHDLVVRCAAAAAVDEEIRRWPLGYASIIGDGGIAVSSGQKQRILLARALYAQPSVIVLDEGTAHLDAESERKVGEHIDGLGITRIIFAHKEETIARADRVFALIDGSLVALERDPIDHQFVSSNMAAAI